MVQEMRWREKRGRPEVVAKCNRLHSLNRCSLPAFPPSRGGWLTVRDRALVVQVARKGPVSQKPLTHYAADAWLLSLMYL